jgi:hypothetical protein
MRARKRLALLLAVGSALASTGAAVAVGALSGQGSASERPSDSVVELEDARIKFEINATDGDGGIQVFVDAEQWKRMSIFDPRGRRIFTTTTEGRMAKQGGTELFLESAEPSFDELPLATLLRRWPEGRYTFRGIGLEGERYRGFAVLTHDLPDGPVLVSPIDGDGPQDPDDTVVRWQPVEPPNGSRIIGYEVIVVRPDTGVKALPNVTLDVMMPPTATSLAVPPGFLEPGAGYEWEVLAVERGGNQTLSSSTFTTAG